MRLCENDGVECLFFMKCFVSLRTLVANMLCMCVVLQENKDSFLLLGWWIDQKKISLNFENCIRCDETKNMDGCLCESKRKKKNLSGKSERK